MLLAIRMFHACLNQISFRYLLRMLYTDIQKHHDMVQLHIMLSTMLILYTLYPLSVRISV